MRLLKIAAAILLVTMAFMVMTGTSCGDKQREIQGISISPSGTVSVTENDTLQFSATVFFNDGSSSTVEELRWVSSNTSVATISGTGFLTAVGAGSAQIHATGGGVDSPVTTVQAAPARVLQSVTIAPKTDTIEINDQVTFSLTANFDTGSVVVTNQASFNATGPGTMNQNVLTSTSDGAITVSGSFTENSVTRTDTATITVNPPVGVTLGANPTSGSFNGTATSTINLTATPNGGTPDGYTWTTSAGTLGAADTGSDPTNTLDFDWQNAGQTITVTVTADFGGVDVSDQVQIPIAAAQAPTITSVTVDGNAVTDGGDAGLFPAGIDVALDVVANDPDGGGFNFNWTAGQGTITNADESTAIWNLAVAEQGTSITIEVSDDNGGGSDSWTFNIGTSLPALGNEEFRVRVIDGSDNDIRLLFEVGDFNSPALGVTVKIDYDDAKISAGGGDGSTHDDNPWGSGLELYFPNLDPSDMTYSGFSATSDGGPIFYIDYSIVGGATGTTNFTIVQPDSVIAEPDGTTFRQPAAVHNAMGVSVE